MEMLKQQLHFLSKKSVDKHNKLKLHTWQNVLHNTPPQKNPKPHTNKKKDKKVCFLKKQTSCIL